MHICVYTYVCVAVHGYVSIPRYLWGWVLGPPPWIPPHTHTHTGFPDGSASEICLQYRRHRSHGFSPWIVMIPWSKIWQPTPVFFPEESHGQMSPIGCSSWGHKESDMTEQAHACVHTHTHTHTYIYCAVLGHDLVTKQQQNNGLRWLMKMNPQKLITKAHISKFSFLLLLKWKWRFLCHVRLFATPWTVTSKSSVHGICQARILEWVAIPFSTGYSWLRDWTLVSCATDCFLTDWATLL